MTKPGKPAHVHRGRKWGEPPEQAVPLRYERLRKGETVWEEVTFPDMQRVLKDTAAKRVRAGGVEQSSWGAQYRLRRG